MMNDFVQLISTVGFPIAACMVVYWQSTKQDEQITNLTKEVMDVVNRNTEALAHFTAILKQKEGDKE